MGGYVSFPDEIVLNRDGSVNVQSIRALQESLTTLIYNYNGKINFGDGASNSQAGNLDAKYINVTTPGANVEFPVKHLLARIPVGYEVVSRDKAGIIYSSREQSWTTSTMFLKCSTATTTIRLRVY